MSENHCRKCGCCCWDFKGNDPANKCEHLAEDMVTCMAYGQEPLACGGLVDNWPDPHHVCDLPEDCGYVLHWKSQGNI